MSEISKGTLADYLDIDVESIREFKQRGDAVFVIDSDFQKLKVSAARLAAHGAEDATAPSSADDLTRLDGVGAVTAEKLAAVGIVTFAQLVAADSEQTAIDCTLPLSKVREWQVAAGVLD